MGDVIQVDSWLAMKHGAEEVVQKPAESIPDTVANLFGGDRLARRGSATTGTRDQLYLSTRRAIRGDPCAAANV